MRYCEVSTTCPGSTTSWKLIVKWLQACCIPVAMLPSGLLLLRRPSQGDVRGWLKAPSPKRLISAGVLSLPAILLPVLSVRSIRWMILWAAAPMYCPYRRSSAFAQSAALEANRQPDSFLCNVRPGGCVHADTLYAHTGIVVLGTGPNYSTHHLLSVASQVLF